MLKRAAVLVVSCGAVLSGCGADPQSENQEIISNLVEAGFPADDIMVVESGNPRDVLSNPQHERTKAFLSKVL